MLRQMSSMSPLMWLSLTSPLLHGDSLQQTLSQNNSARLAGYAQSRLKQDYRKTWRLWLHELIDWSQPEYVVPSMSTSDNYLHIPETSLARKEFLKIAKVMGLSSVDSSQYRNIEVPASTEEGRARFNALLLTLKQPYWSPYVYIGQYNVADGAWDLWHAKLFAKPLREFPSETSEEWQKQVETWIHNLENFSSEYPNDKFLGAYTLLYAGILRMNWNSSPDTIVKGFTDIEADVDAPAVVRMMSGWYRTIFLCYLQPKRSTQLLQKFIEHYKDGEWNVVSIANQMLKSPHLRLIIIKRCIYSPIRRPDLLAKLKKYGENFQE